MIETVYPDHIQAQLDLLDEKIAEIYEQELPNMKQTSCILNIVEKQRIKRNLYERIRPLLDEKARLIQNSVPKYIIRS